MLKKITALILVVLIALFSAACGGSKKVNKTQTSMKKGVPVAAGDVFAVPDIKSGAEGAPVISAATFQAGPNDTVTLTGEGFSSENIKAFVYSQTTSDNGKSSEADFAVTDDSVMAVTVDKSVDYGMYAVYLQNSKGMSNVFLINRPEIWWVSSASVTSGDSLSIYGQNLTSNNSEGKSYVYLLSEDDEYCEAAVTYADPYKVTVKVPDCLRDGKPYTVRIHNGHGGDSGFADSEEKITYHGEKPIKYNGKTINVTDFGADPKDKSNDDTSAIQSALDSAQDGDTVYFPKGTYLVTGKGIKSSLSLKLKGDGGTDSHLISDNDIAGPMFSFTSGPVEFTGLYFSHDRTGGTISSSFINFSNGINGTLPYSLYVHDCQFKQSVSASFRSTKACISSENSLGILVENNISEATSLINARQCEKIFVRNNKHKGMLYCGNFYGQSSMVFYGDRKADVSGNQLSGKDMDTDSSLTLDKDELTAGRMIGIQGLARDMYISKNTVVHSGLPDDNAGEQIMLENVPCIYEGFAVSAGEKEITIPDDCKFQLTSGSLVNVVYGKGKGQVREVVKKNGNKISLKENWLITPDSTSRIYITDASVNIAIYANDMNCYANYLENPGATCGVQLYSNSYNVYITANKFKNMASGLSISTHYRPKTNGNPNFKNIIYWTQVDGNKIENVGIGIRHVFETDNMNEPIINNAAIGVMFRHNTFSNIADYKPAWYKNTGGVGIACGTSGADEGAHRTNSWPGAWLLGTVIENNNFTGCAVADIYFYKHQDKTLLRGNNGDKGNANCVISPMAAAPIYLDY